MYLKCQYGLETTECESSSSLCSVHSDILIRWCYPLHTILSLDTALLPPLFIVHFLALRLPSERALKFFHEWYPPGMGRARCLPEGTVNKKTVLKRMCRTKRDSDVRAVFPTTCQQCRDLSAPRGLFCHQALVCLPSSNLVAFVLTFSLVRIR